MEIPILKSLSRGRRKLVYWLCGLFLFYTIVGFFILPPIIRSVAVKQLTKQFDREVSIQKVKLNPLTFSVAVRGLLIKDKDGAPFISWDEVYVNFQLSSLLGKAWSFREITVNKPFVRAQINKDKSFNFSDLIAKFSAPTTNVTPIKQAAPPSLHIGKLHIAGATASFTDLTPREPFKRVVGPVDVALEDFRTDSDHTNAYAITGTSDAGDQFSGKGFFQLDPVRSQGDVAVSNIVLNSFAPLYQDILKFNIKDGVAEFHTTYHIELSETNRVASVTNTSFALRSLKVSEPGKEMNLIEQSDFSVSGVSVDAVTHQAEINSIASSGARVFVKRDKDATVNVIELAKPTDVVTNAPGGIEFLLHSVTNVVAMFINSTNQWTGIIHEASSRDGALTFEDLFNTRPVNLELDQLTLVAKNISNLSGTNLTADFSVRWNTNGLIKTTASASFQPFTADIHFAVTNLDLHPVDPYLESKLDLIIVSSSLGMNGDVRLRTPVLALPEVKFKGDVWLDDFSTVDGTLGEDLLKWSALRITGIDANLIPPSVAIKEISLNDAYARVIIETNNTINLLTALRMSNTNAPGETNMAIVAQQTSVPPPGKEYAPQVSIASIVISNAQTRFTDRTFSPGVNMSIEQFGGTIAGLSSDQLQHADVKLSAQVDGVGPVEITGTINPLVKNQTTDLTVKIRNVELTPTSPYVGKYAGYRLAKGKFEADFSYHIADRKIKAGNLITLNQFTFGEKVDSPDATHLPVRLAIAILKDREGKIVLDVPVEGNLDDPKFRLGKVIWGAVLNIITKVATSPFSVLGAVFGGNGDELSYQDFAAGSSEVQPGSKAKLDSLIKGLYERPGLQLAIEGSVDPVTDRAGLKLATLDKRLRASKWMSLQKSGQTDLTADQVTLTPDERGRLVEELYRAALANGEIQMTQPGLLQPGTPQTNTVPTAAAAVRSTSGEKGAQLLMRGYNQVTGLFSEKIASTKPPTIPPTVTGPYVVVDEMESELLNSIGISDSDFEALATERAKAVRAYILQSRQVEADRIFLTEIQAGGVKTQGSKAYLQLQ